MVVWKTDPGTRKIVKVARTAAYPVPGIYR